MEDNSVLLKNEIEIYQQRNEIYFCEHPESFKLAGWVFIMFTKLFPTGLEVSYFV